MTVKVFSYVFFILLFSNLVSNQSYAQVYQDTCAEALDLEEDIKSFNAVKAAFLKDPSVDNLNQFAKPYNDLLSKAEDIQDTELHDAASKGDISKIRSIISKGMPVDVRGQGGMTPLSVAAMFGHIEAIDALLDLGADIKALDTVGNSSLIYAVSKSQADVVEHLLKKGADINKANLLDETPIMFAVKVGDQDMFRTLVSHGANLMSIDIKGWTLLHLATIYRRIPNRIGMIETILDTITTWPEPGIINWPDIVSVDSPLHWAASKGRTDVINVLLKEGANLRVENKDGELPIHVAACFDQLEAFEMLIGVNAILIEAVDDKGQTPVEIARANDSQKILSELGL